MFRKLMISAFFFLGLVHIDKSCIEASWQVAAGYEKAVSAPLVRIEPLNEFQNFIELFETQNRSQLSPSGRRKLHEIRESLKEKISLLADPRDHQLSPLAMRQLEFIYLRVQDNNSQIDIAAFRKDLKAFVKDFHKGKISSLEQQWEAIDSLLLEIDGNQPESLQALPELFVQYLVLRHGLKPSLSISVVCRILELSEAEFDSVSSLSEKLSIEIPRQAATRLRHQMRRFFEILSEHQIATLSKRSGLTQDDLRSVITSIDIDKAVESLASQKCRKLSRKELRILPDELKLKVADRPRTKPLAARYFVSDSSILRKATDEDSRLYKKAMRLGYSHLNLSLWCLGFRELFDVGGAELTEKQRDEFDNLYREWANTEAPSDLVGFNRRCDLLISDLDSILLPVQSSRLYLANIGWNGGFSSFLLCPSVIDDLGLTNNQIESIQKIRRDVHNELAEVSLNLKLKFLTDSFSGCDDVTRRISRQLLSQDSRFQESLGRAVLGTLLKQQSKIWKGGKTDVYAVPSDQQPFSNELLKAFEKRFVTNN